MDNSTQSNELLMKYLDGEMSEIEKKDFEKRLLSDTDLRQELEKLQLATEAVQMYGLRQQVGSVHRQMMKEMQSQVVIRKISSTRRIIRYSISVAAGILLIVIGIQVYNFINLSPDKLYKKEYSSFELSTSRDINPPASSPTEKAFREKKYKEVVELRTKMAEASLTDDFLAAVSFLELNRPADAIKLFNIVLNQDKASSHPVYKDEAEYYLALAYLKIKNYTQALELMKSIHNDSTNLYHEKFTSGFIRKVKMLKSR
jgi:tetratricopeptide (TPR) repeat protein